MSWNKRRFYEKIILYLSGERNESDYLSSSVVEPSSIISYLMYELSYIELNVEIICLKLAELPSWNYRGFSYHHAETADRNL